MAQKPHEGLAGAVNQLTEETHVLIRREIRAAQRETLEKAKESLPAIALIGGAGILATFAAAASYRAVVRTIEKVLPPVAAATLAAGLFAAGGAGLAAAGIARLRQAPLPVPAETAKDASRAVAEAAEQVG